MADSETAAMPVPESGADPVAATRATPYAWYALGILFLVYVLSVDKKVCFHYFE